MTISFNLRPGNSLGTPSPRLKRREQEIGLPDTIATTFSGSAAEFRS